MEQKENVIDCYKKTAATYSDQMLNELDNKPFDRWILKTFAEENKIQGLMLDIGCGPGQTTGFMRNHGVDNILGLDLSPAMVKKASENFPEIDFEVGDMLDLKKEKNSIGSIIAFYAIVHLKDKELEKAVQEIYRVLQPNGEFLFSCHEGNETIHQSYFLDQNVNVSFYCFADFVLFNALEKAGFKVMEAYQRYPYDGVEYPSKRLYVRAKKPLED